LRDRTRILSKSKYISGLQCLKYLWTLIHDPDNVPEPDLNTQYVFDQGHKVGELATQLFPGGIYISTDDFMGNIRQTEVYLKQRKPLFEAGIHSAPLYSRIDILNPVGAGEWDIIEVKSSTGLKDVHAPDVSFQKLCCEKQGLRIRNCFLAHINNEYVKNGEIDPKEFFSVVDITSEVDVVSEGIEERVNTMLTIISDGTCPEASIGKHCSDPYPCFLEEKCWGFLPEGSIFDLRGGKKNQFALFEQGIISIKDIPESVKLSRQQQIQKECLLTGMPHIQKEEINGFLERLHYPLYYLDFETIGPAIPLFDGTRPYQTIPFQFSLHVVENSESNPKHYSYLAEGIEDPRPKLLDELQKMLGSDGSIIAYNAGFEEGVLRELVEAFPKYNSWLAGILERIVDLLTPFSNFHYYHSMQKGSASLKRVLPAVTGNSYEEMNIGAGMDASILFEKTTFGEASEEERSRVRSDLTEYCKLDTEGMIWIVDKLRELGR